MNVVFLLAPMIYTTNIPIRLNCKIHTLYIRSSRHLLGLFSCFFRVSSDFRSFFLSDNFTVLWFFGRFIGIFVVKVVLQYSYQILYIVFIVQIYNSFQSFDCETRSAFDLKKDEMFRNCETICLEDIVIAFSLFTKSYKLSGVMSVYLIKLHRIPNKF